MFEAATRRGVLVLMRREEIPSRPLEHAFSLLLSVARKIRKPMQPYAEEMGPEKSEGCRALQQDARRHRHGSDRSELSRRAIVFGMRVIAYDPYSPATPRREVCRVNLSMNWTICLQLPISFSLPTPLTPETPTHSRRSALQRANAACASFNARGRSHRRKRSRQCIARSTWLPLRRSMSSKLSHYQLTRGFVPRRILFSRRI